MIERPRLLTIAATDTSGGAGIHADAQVAAAFGIDHSVLVCAITAQSSRGVQALQPVDLTMADQQWHALQQDGGADAVRVGWLPDLASWLPWLSERLLPASVVWDPVLSASLGGMHSQAPSAEVLSTWLACCGLVTPNTRELAQLASWLGCQGNEAEQVQALLAHGCQMVVVTGGDDSHEQVLTRVYTQLNVDTQYPEQAAVETFHIGQQRWQVAVHGSGCHFSAALAAMLAKGMRPYDAVLQASVCMDQWLQQPSPRPGGYHHLHVDRCWSWYELSESSDWPEIYAAPEASVEFAAAEPSLGLYALVDTLEWLQQLLALGVDTLQWRVKQRSASYRDDMQQAITACQQAGVPLYINDDWQSAIALGAYGVHLGQEDLATADLAAIADAGLRIGISTHTDFEVLRAWQLRPSYIAFGPVHPPLSKQLKYPPLGYPCLSQWWRALRPQLPLTCIGGITDDNIAQVVAQGVDSCAIVTSLMPGADLAQRHARLRRHLPSVKKSSLEIA
ncbi:hypothetical protein CHH28_12800 [Bacterioplanes sanyensis]|uniref:Uncharacterized protein n=1 Tax=Bacterioplanes sanyensis TaxID=1249553 RepID=A0A222FLM9_9GAMM|nr:thiamine phosphate synthase [Bacterioplanes sanyensis]ASP39496.1 hypothetical protein CHH28_12800 [Bacterioplanes sanyensis]